MKVVVDEPANFDPRIALKKIQNALLAHPDINIVISSWDDMSRGVEQAVIAAGKTPGKDVKIFSGGATKVGVDKVKAGTWAQTTAYLPYQEAYYGAVALMMALEGKPINAYIDEALLAGNRQHHRHDLHHQGQRRQVRAGLLSGSNAIGRSGQSWTRKWRSKRVVRMGADGRSADTKA